MNFLLFSFCCSIFFLSINLNPLIQLERLFAAPLYNLRTYLSREDPYPLHIAPKKEYSIVLVGDSMTAFLGNTVEIKDYLGEYYPGKKINVLNYGIGSTNILSIPERLESGSIKGTETLFPILSKDLDIIFIESMGNNPINVEGSDPHKLQKETLDKIVEIIRRNKPKAVIVFMATISPNRQRYGDGVFDLALEERRMWAEERIRYFENHINYAKERQIPLLNIFEKSLDEEGDGNVDYLKPKDFIHPSPTGIEFISREIADFLFKSRIIPL